MRLLLDSNIIIWRLRDDPILSEATQQLIDDPDNEVGTSVACLWEMEIKRRKGRLDLPIPAYDALMRAEMEIIPITAEDALEAAALPLHHQDPFDRMLIAQARRHGWTIITADAAFARYQVALMAP